MTQQQPDWDSIAEKFDHFLPHIAPVGDALINSMNFAPGEQILDVASGTGEPALTIAQRFPHCMVTGSDAAAGMVKAAQNKANKAKLENLKFVAMPAENLEFPDNSFDKAVCRFGVMLFQDPKKGVEEIQRVLKPGGQFSMAVWSHPESFTTLNWSYQVFKGKVADDNLPPLEIATSLSDKELLTNLLTDAGFSDINIETHHFNYQFLSFDEYWDMNEKSEIMKQQFDALPESERDNIRNEIARFAHDFQTENGLVIPHEFVLATATATATATA